MALKQWPPKFHMKFRNIDPPPPYLGIIPKKTTYCSLQNHLGGPDAQLSPTEQRAALHIFKYVQVYCVNVSQSCLNVSQ